MANNASARTKSPTIRVAVAAVTAALVCVATFLIQIPNPATRGYINVGDAMIMASALTFGTTIGGFAGGIGSALSDIISGYGYFFPLTLLVKGIEGGLAGRISDGKDWRRDILAVVVGGGEMVIGYFLGEAFIYGYGPAALTEVPGNIFQMLVGGVVGIPLAMAVRRYRTNYDWRYKHPSHKESNGRLSSKWSLKRTFSLRRSISRRKEVSQGVQPNYPFLP
jgi:uncharacterized membrane protein